MNLINVLLMDRALSYMAFDIVPLCQKLCPCPLTLNYCSLITDASASLKYQYHITCLYICSQNIFLEKQQQSFYTWPYTQTEKHGLAPEIRQGPNRPSLDRLHWICILTNGLMDTWLWVTWHFIYIYNCPIKEPHAVLFGYMWLCFRHCVFRSTLTLPRSEHLFIYLPEWTIFSCL